MPYVYEPIAEHLCLSIPNSIPVYCKNYCLVTSGSRKPRGTVWQCGVCRQLWVATMITEDGGWTYWRKLTWWRRNVTFRNHGHVKVG